MNDNKNEGDVSELLEWDNFPVESEEVGEPDTPFTVDVTSACKNISSPSEVCSSSSSNDSFHSLDGRKEPTRPEIRVEIDISKMFASNKKLKKGPLLAANPRSPYGQSEAAVGEYSLVITRGSSVAEGFKAQLCLDLDKLAYCDAWVKDPNFTKVKCKDINSGQTETSGSSSDQRVCAQDPERAHETEEDELLSIDESIEAYLSCTLSEKEWDFYSLSESRSTGPSQTSSYERITDRTSSLNANYQYHLTPQVSQSCESIGREDELSNSLTKPKGRSGHDVFDPYSFNPEIFSDAKTDGEMPFPGQVDITSTPKAKHTSGYAHNFCESHSLSRDKICGTKPENVLGQIGLDLMEMWALDDFPDAFEEQIVSELSSGLNSFEGKSDRIDITCTKVHIYKAEEDLDIQEGGIDPEKNNYEPLSDDAGEPYASYPGPNGQNAKEEHIQQEWTYKSTVHNHSFPPPVSDAQQKVDDDVSEYGPVNQGKTEYVRDGIEEVNISYTSSEIISSKSENKVKKLAKIFSEKIAERSTERETDLQCNIFTSNAWTFADTAEQKFTHDQTSWTGKEESFETFGPTVFSEQQRKPDNRNVQDIAPLDRRANEEFSGDEKRICSEYYFGVSEDNDTEKRMTTSFDSALAHADTSNVVSARKTPPPPPPKRGKRSAQHTKKVRDKGKHSCQSNDQKKESQKAFPSGSTYEKNEEMKKAESLDKNSDKLQRIRSLSPSLTHFFGVLVDDVMLDYLAYEKDMEDQAREHDVCEPFISYKNECENRKPSDRVASLSPRLTKQEMLRDPYCLSEVGTDVPTISQEDNPHFATAPVNEVEAKESVGTESASTSEKGYEKGLDFPSQKVYSVETKPRYLVNEAVQCSPNPVKDGECQYQATMEDTEGFSSIKHDISSNTPIKRSANLSNTQTKFGISFNLETGTSEQIQWSNSSTEDHTDGKQSRMVFNCELINEQGEKHGTKDIKNIEDETTSKESWTNTDGIELIDKETSMSQAQLPHQTLTSEQRQLDEETASSETGSPVQKFVSSLKWQDVTTNRNRIPQPDVEKSSGEYSVSEPSEETAPSGVGYTAPTVIGRVIESDLWVDSVEAGVGNAEGSYQETPSAILEAKLRLEDVKTQTEMLTEEGKYQCEVGGLKETGSTLDDSDDMNKTKKAIVEDLPGENFANSNHGNNGTGRKHVSFQIDSGINRNDIKEKTDVPWDHDGSLAEEGERNEDKITKSDPSKEEEESLLLDTEVKQEETSHIGEEHERRLSRFGKAFEKAFDYYFRDNTIKPEKEEENETLRKISQEVVASVFNSISNGKDSDLLCDSFSQLSEEKNESFEANRSTFENSEIFTSAAQVPIAGTEKDHGIGCEKDYSEDDTIKLERKRSLTDIISGDNTQVFEAEATGKLEEKISEEESDALRQISKEIIASVFETITKSWDSGIHCDKSSTLSEQKTKSFETRRKSVIENAEKFDSANEASLAHIGKDHSTDLEKNYLPDDTYELERKRSQMDIISGDKTSVSKADADRKLENKMSEEESEALDQISKEIVANIFMTIANETDSSSEMSFETKKSVIEKVDNFVSAANGILTSLEKDHRMELEERLGESNPEMCTDTETYLRRKGECRETILFSNANGPNLKETFESAVDDAPCIQPSLTRVLKNFAEVSCAPHQDSLIDTSGTCNTRKNNTNYQAEVLYVHPDTSTDGKTFPEIILSKETDTQGSNDPYGYSSHGEEETEWPDDCHLKAPSSDNLLVRIQEQDVPVKYYEIRHELISGARSVNSQLDSENKSTSDLYPNIINSFNNVESQIPGNSHLQNDYESERKTPSSAFIPYHPDRYDGMPGASKARSDDFSFRLGRNDNNTNEPVEETAGIVPARKYLSVSQIYSRRENLKQESSGGNLEHVLDESHIGFLPNPEVDPNTMSNPSQESFTRAVEKENNRVTVFFTVADAPKEEIHLNECMLNNDT